MALLFAATACQDNFQRAEVYALQSRALYDAGDRIGAYTAIRQAIALRDDNASYFILLGAVDLRMNDPVGAFKAFTQALELDEANLEALSYVANVGLQVGRVSEASAAADRLLSLNPNSTVGLQVKGLTEMFGNHDDQARLYADRILKISPGDEAGTIIQARLLAKTGKFEDALGIIDAAMATSPPTPGLLVTKINLYRALRQPEAMARSFEELIALIPSPANSLRLDQINLLYKLGRVDAAREVVTKLLATGQVDLADYQTLQRIWFEFDDQPYTRETIKQAKNWSDPIALISVARYLLWQGHPQVADDLYFAVKTGIRPAGQGLHNRAQRALSDRKTVQSENETFLKRDSEDVDALILYADYEHKAGNRNLATEALQKAVDIDPLDPEAYALLAELREASGAHARATQAFEDGLKRLPQDFLLIERYVQFLHQSGDKGRAVSATRNFARAVPASAKAWSIFEAQCRWAGDAACVVEAEAGRRNAQSLYRVDDPPGSPSDRGLLSKFQIRDE